MALGANEGAAVEHIPVTIDEITPAWLAAATGLGVERVEVEQIGVGVGVSSALYRLRLSGSGCPDTVIVKLPALDEAAVFTSTMLRMYLREVGFFRELCHRSPIRVPVCHYGAVDPATSQFALVMEDIGHLRAVDQVGGMAPADAALAVDGLAAWHATWWRQADVLAENGLTVSLGDEIYKTVLPIVFAEGIEKLRAELDVPPDVDAVSRRWIDAMPRLLDGLADAPTTMTHGDYRADNLFFQPDGAVATVDFQLIGTGHGAYDLAYFVTQSLDPADATTHEAALFDRWRTGLVAAGVPEDDLGDSWDQYRAAALFCLVYPVVAWRGMDAGDRRQVDLANVMLQRFERAATALDLAALL